MLIEQSYTTNCRHQQHKERTSVGPGRPPEGRATTLMNLNMRSISSPLVTEPGPFNLPPHKGIIITLAFWPALYGTGDMGWLGQTRCMVIGMHGDWCLGLRLAMRRAFDWATPLPIWQKHTRANIIGRSWSWVNAGGLFGANPSMAGLWNAATLAIVALE